MTIRSSFAKTDFWQARLESYLTLLHGRTPDLAEVMPVGQHIELMKEHQRAINRITVLENELHYSNLNMMIGSAGTRFLRNMHNASQGIFKARDLLTRQRLAGNRMKRSLSFPVSRSSYDTSGRFHLLAKEFEDYDRSNDTALRQELTDAYKKIAILSSERASLLSAHARSSLQPQVQSQYSGGNSPRSSLMLPRSGGNSPRSSTIGLGFEVDGKHFNILEFKNAVREFGSNPIEVRDTDLRELKLALSDLRSSQDQHKFSKHTKGLTLRSR
eukprot:CAMPEP_0169160532 /NCGR_PEP_ID=MMETSP1015-20121227/56512_1 /TAXON_ID=342587 /ORGANISM="Karlodinium micrum, Strain CCMP2283" /LENGTH=271 /DNA_ID=CAMNT_0009232229 /DNA_START=526 /DNA_END=1337 /DNA_ORIENTATION=-